MVTANPFATPEDRKYTNVKTTDAIPKVSEIHARINGFYRPTESRGEKS